jgi:drug/metabolite transporter (DMT)-like permease
MATTSDYLKLHLLVFLWGFTAILGKLVTIPAVEMVFYRTLLAAIGMGIVIVIFRGSFKVSNSDLIKLLLTGAIVAAHWLTFFISGRISNPSTSLVGFATCSLWAAFIEPIAKKNKIQAVEVGLGLVVILGLYLIFSFDFQYPIGLLLGILSGLTCAIFSVVNSQLVTRVNSLTITFYEMIGATIAVALFFPLYQSNFTADGQLHLAPVWSDWLWIAVLSLVCTVYAYAVAINLTKKLSVFFIQLTLNLEPVYGIILALIVFGQSEVMSWNFYLGTVVILAAVIAYPFVKDRFTKKPKPFPHTGP